MCVFGYSGFCHIHKQISFFTNNYISRIISQKIPKATIGVVANTQFHEQAGILHVRVPTVEVVSAGTDSQTFSV